MTHHARGESGQAGARGLAAGLRTGWWVFLVLMAVTILEYFVALAVDSNLPIMVVMNIADAALIMWYFMHVYRVWRRPEE